MLIQPSVAVLVSWPGRICASDYNLGLACPSSKSRQLETPRFSRSRSSIAGPRSPDPSHQATVGSFRLQVRDAPAFDVVTFPFRSIDDLCSACWDVTLGARS